MISVAVTLLVIGLLSEMVSAIKKRMGSKKVNQKIPDEFLWLLTDISHLYNRDITFAFTNIIERACLPNNSWFRLACAYDENFDLLFRYAKTNAISFELLVGKLIVLFKNSHCLMTELIESDKSLSEYSTAKNEWNRLVYQISNVADKTFEIDTRSPGSKTYIPPLLGQNTK